MLKYLTELITLSQNQPGMRKGAVAAAHDSNVLEAVTEAKKRNIADSILIGDVDVIRGMLRNMGESSENYEIIPSENDDESARKAVGLVREGKAQFLMKGLLSTSDMMRAVVDKENGIRGDRLLSSVMLLETERYSKLLCLTDGGMCTFPTFEQKKEILKNAAMMLQRLGYGQIYAACICGAETVNSKIQSTVDAQQLSRMTKMWEPYHLSVYGPVGLDLAISEESCHHKHYKAEGAGKADILLVPTYEVGNGIGKAIMYFGNTKNAGVILGAEAPIVLVSRSDSSESKLLSIALASVAG